MTTSVMYPSGHKKKILVNTNPKPTDITLNAYDYCPRCGTELISKQCKRKCTKCNYFIDCGDAY